MLPLAGLSLLAGCGAGAGARPVGDARLVHATEPTAAGVRLVYRAEPTAAARVEGASLEQVVRIVRRRLAQLGLAQWPVRRVRADEIEVVLPQKRGTPTPAAQIGETARLEFYDWEPNVIGPDGTPAPDDLSVTGGPESASVKRGLLEYQAALRAAKRPAILRRNDTTLAPGCTAEQVGGCLFGSWYLLDTRHEEMLCAGGGQVCRPRDTKAELYADGYKPPPGSKPKAVHVNPGTILVQARPVISEREPGKVIIASPNSFYVLNDDPVLSGSDIRDPQQGFQEGGSNNLLHETGSGPPDVDFQFTPSGRKIFERVTREIAARGRNAQLPGVPKQLAMQHFAVVFDEQVITAPSIDYTVYPEGIDAAYGSQITGGFTVASARNLARELQAGTLPLQLELVSQTTIGGTTG